MSPSVGLTGDKTTPTSLGSTGDDAMSFSQGFTSIQATPHLQVLTDSEATPSSSGQFHVHLSEVNPFEFTNIGAKSNLFFLRNKNQQIVD